MSEVKEIQKEIDQICGFGVNPQSETVKLLRLIALEQAKIIDLLNIRNIFN